MKTNKKDSPWSKRFSWCKCKLLSVKAVLWPDTQCLPDAPAGDMYPAQWDFYHCGLVGGTRTGKSWALMRILENSPDFIAIFPGGKDEPKYREISTLYFAERPTREIKEAIAHCAKKGQRIACSIIPISDNQVEEIVGLAFTLGNIVMAVDEAHEWCSPSYVLPAIKRAARRGAALNVKLVLVSQRPMDLNNDILSQCELLIVFCLWLEADLCKVEQVTGLDVGDELRALPVRHCVISLRGELI